MWRSKGIRQPGAAVNDRFIRILHLVTVLTALFGSGCAERGAPSSTSPAKGGAQELQWQIRQERSNSRPAADAADPRPVSPKRVIKEPEPKPVPVPASDGRVHALLRGKRWIAYDSPHFDPYVGAMPTERQIVAELKRLSAAGFDGLIHFGSNAVFGSIPRLAKEEAGFSAVIMGIWVGDDQQRPSDQMRQAVDAARWADAYCIGHFGDRGIELGKLKKWQEELRTQTGRPVSATFPLSAYFGKNGAEVCDVGDWCFPDVHGDWSRGSSPQKILDHTRRAISQFKEAKLAKPVLLKMVSYPSAGAPGLTVANQKEFFQRLLQDDLPDGIFLSVLGAYDVPFKREDRGWARPERYIGLFDETGRAKPVVELFRPQGGVKPSRPSSGK